MGYEGLRKRFAFPLAIMICLAACGRLAERPAAPTAEPAAAPTAEPTAEPTAAPPPVSFYIEDGAEEPEPSAEPPAEAPPEPPALPDGFVYVRDIDPRIRAELRYATADNFTGAAADGYYSAEAAIMTRAAAEALSRAQTELEADGLGLLIYDAYRPQRASNYFAAWARNGDEAAKAEYYPNEDKGALHKKGYIASRSKHSGGDTVDLTLVDLATGAAADMGGHFDLLDPLSRHGAAGLSEAQAANRLRLKTAMARHGFAAYSAEWWHYSYGEPTFPGVYFDFDVR